MPVDCFMVALDVVCSVCNAVDPFLCLYTLPCICTQFVQSYPEGLMNKIRVFILELKMHSGGEVWHYNSCQIKAQH